MRKKIIIFLILMLVFLAGCNSGRNDNPYTELKSITGTTGLEMKFLPNHPPSEIAQDSIFEIALELTNKGIADIKEGYLVLGHESDFIDVIDWQPNENIGQVYDYGMVSFNLFGIDLTSRATVGEKATSIIRLKTKELGINQEKYKTGFYVTACYDYGTLAIEDICIDTKKAGVVGPAKVCEPRPISLSGQGAPIAIKKIEYTFYSSEQERKVQPVFIIEIYNSGRGITLKKGAARESCSGKGIDPEKKDIIEIDAEFAGQRLKCGEDNLVKLNSNKAKIRCELEEGIDMEEGNYWSQLRLELKYGYSESVSKDMTITRT